MKPIVIAEYVRSPFTIAYKGELARVRPDEMASQVIKGLLQRAKIDAEEVEDLIVGCAFPEGEQGFNMARLIGFLADLPFGVGGVTVNRFCGSSMQAIHMAAGAMQMDAGEAYICAGVESMSRIPMTGFNPMPHPDLYERYPEAYMGMGETAENIAENYDLSREQQDSFAVESQRKAVEAQKSGRLKKEIIPIETKSGKINEDGCIRADTTNETLGDLKPAFSEAGSVTAGTSSPLTDGASAVLVTTEEFAEKNGLEPLARIKSFAVSGCKPEIMGIGPVVSSKKAMKRAGITADDLDVIELNEAFSSQSLAAIQDLELDIAKINVDGGALALGHPLGATGARITGKAAQILRRDGGRYALSTQCIGGGQGIATVLEAA
ncbi:MAG TPA: thiolase family protein [Rhodospirillales bacterium]|nr:thiolase family protein [Alphaproteobacteria bacterium]HIA81845.1 thiolase family protein [Rhodospirillales bacterium]HIB21643.1 thiolase family protein [Rhodospirillales bacterium]HIC58976.1 thiolase family protein [Rhodospirillales bacterium]HIN92099.1 thiolase family protein [Alphaproteobacteria bacterium]